MSQMSGIIIFGFKKAGAPLIVIGGVVSGFLLYKI